MALEVGGSERVHVDHRLERVVVGRPAVAVVRLARADEAAPHGRGRDPCPLRQRRDPVAVARRLAGEQQHAARPQHAPELRERALQLRQVVEHGMAEDEVEARVLERQRGGVARRGLDLQAEARGVRPQRVEHPRRDIRADARADHAVLHQVEREVARAGADLERARERPRPPPEQLLDLAEHLRAADRAEVDAPLRVVAAGRHVVVAAVDVEDLLRWRPWRGGRLAPRVVRTAF